MAVATGRSGTDPQDALQGRYVPFLGVSHLGHHQGLLVLGLAGNEVLRAHERLHTHTTEDAIACRLRPAVLFRVSGWDKQTSLISWWNETHLGAHRG